MAVSGANLHNVLMLLTLEPHLARNPYLVLHVRRNHLVSDTLRELTMYSDVDLKKPLKVSFFQRLNFDQRKIFSLPQISVLFVIFSSSSPSLQVIFDGEEAVDAGGVTKEFFLLLLKELMDPVYGMFTHYNESNLLWFSDKVSYSAKLNRFPLLMKIKYLKITINLLSVVESNMYSVAVFKFKYNFKLLLNISILFYYCATVQRENMVHFIHTAIITVGPFLDLEQHDVID